MSEGCTHDCSSCSQNCGERIEPQNFLEKPHELTHVKKIIAVVSGKGGVGKSMVTSLLSVTMQRRSHRTAVLDADITGPSIPKSFGVNGEKAAGNELGIFPVKTKTDIGVMSLNCLLENESDPVVWRGPVIAGAVKQFWTDVIWGDVDYMFVDMPPGTGDVPITVFQSLPIDGIVVVTSPQELVEMIVNKAVKMADMMDIPIIGIVQNMSYFECSDCGKKHYPFGTGRVKEVAAEHGIQTVCELPIDPALSKACDDGVIELFEGDWLESLADTIEKL